MLWVEKNVPTKASLILFQLCSCSKKQDLTEDIILSGSSHKFKILHCIANHIKDNSLEDGSMLTRKQMLELKLLWEWNVITNNPKNCNDLCDFPSI